MAEFHEAQLIVALSIKTSQCFRKPAF